MGDLIKGETFAAGEIVTAPRLHKHVEDAVIKNGAVTKDKLADGAVTKEKLGTDVVMTASQVTVLTDNLLIGDATAKGKSIPVDLTTITLTKSSGTPPVAAPMLGVKDAGIAAAQLAANAVTTPAILDKNVTLAKIADVETQRILGRGTAGTGPVEKLTIGTGLTLSTGGVLSASAVPGSGIVRAATTIIALNGATGILTSDTHTIGEPFGASLYIRCVEDDPGVTHYVVGDMIAGNQFVWAENFQERAAVGFYLNATSFAIFRVTQASNGECFLPRKDDATPIKITAANEHKFAVMLTFWS